MAEIRRVLLVQPLAGARWRSINAYAMSLRAMLQSAGIQADVVSAPWFNPPSVVHGARVRWTRQPELQLAANGHYDVVHLTDQALAHHVTRFSRNTPVAVTCHDLMPFLLPGYYRTQREAFLKRAFLRRSVRSLPSAGVVLAVSEYARGQLESMLGLAPSQVPVVPNVVRQPFAPAPRPAAEGALRAAGFALPTAPRILSVGNERAYKNLSALARALAHPSLVHASLVRVGEPMASVDAKVFREAGVGRRMTEFRDVSDEHLALLYASCDVLVQPSLAEGFGVPVVEAMACGLPVVTSDGGALAEVGDGAAVVVPLHGDDFAARLASGISSAMAEAPRLARSGLERARAFEPAAVLPRLLDAYALGIARDSARR